LRNGTTNSYQQISTNARKSLKLLLMKVEGKFKTTFHWSLDGRRILDFYIGSNSTLQNRLVR
jgi:hypothetical protein